MENKPILINKKFNPFSENDLGQIKKLEFIVKRIIDYKYENDPFNLYVKVAITPKDMQNKLIKKELKKIQKRLLKFKDGLMNLLSDFLKEYRYYIDVLAEKNIDNSNFEYYKDYPNTWIDKFIRRFVFFIESDSDFYEYLNFDYDSIIEKINSNDIGILKDTESLIPLTNFNNLINCLISFTHFQFIFEQYNEIVKGNEANLTDNKYRGQKEKKGFKSTLKLPQIESLFNQLKGDYISENTSPEHFRAIFKDVSLPVGFIPIKKTKKFHTTLCAFFISDLFQKENPTDYWNIAENCFEVKNLRQSFNNAYTLNPNSKPKGYSKMDEIIKTIYNPLQ